MQREQARTRTLFAPRWTIVGCRFGSQRRRARLRFMPTDCGFQPVIGFLPQISHVWAMEVSPIMNEPAHAFGGAGATRC